MLFVTLSPLAALAGTIAWFASGLFNVQTLVLAVVMAMFAGLGITGGYHRMFSHRSFRAPWPVRLGFLLAASAGIEESAWSWCRDHRRHHRYVDREGDPHNILHGFWYAHFSWLFRKDTWDLQDAGASDLWKDPLVRFQHRFYLPVAIPMAFGVPVAIASFWGDPWGGLLIAGLARIVVNQHLTFAINSVCHSIGEQPYSDRHTARDNWVTALFTYGEGYHNFHHEFASDYRNGLKVYAWDPTKWLIYSLWKLRLVSEVRVTDAGIIAAKKARMQAIRLAKAAAGAGNDLAHAPRQAHGMLAPMTASSMGSSGKG